MACTFTPAEPSALNTLPETPGSPAMPSPTTARIARSRVHLDALDLAFLDLAIEGGGHHARGAFGFDAGNGAADRMLRAALRNQDDRDALFAQRAEQAMRGAGHADHAGAFDVHHRDVLDAGDALHRQFGVGLGADQRARLLRREGVADPDRNAAADGRRHGLRVDDLGAEVRELHGFVVRQRIDDLGIGHAARIGRQHAVDVGPDVDLAGVEQRAEDRTREVAAVAPERRLHAAPVARR